MWAVFQASTMFVSRGFEPENVFVASRRRPRCLVGLVAGQCQCGGPKSTVSRRFVQMSSEQLRNWLAAPTAGLDLPVVVIDGIYLADSVILVALGIDAAAFSRRFSPDQGTTANTRN
jgi:putative transposase